MDKDTKELKTFIHSYKETSSFSQESRVFIDRIFRHIQQGSLLFKSESSFFTESLKELPTGKQYSLIDQDIKQEIENLHGFKKTVFHIGERTFQIYTSFYKDSAANKKYLDKCLQHIYIWLYIGSHFSVPNCSAVLDIYIYFTDLKKRLPEIEGEPIAAEHANTAFTFACSSPGSLGNEIYIYRAEEWFKVLIHESFHSFGLDFAAMDQTAIQSRICGGDIYSVPCTDLRFYESYTETWAEILQCMFAAFYENGGEYDTTCIGKLEKWLFEYEAPFSAFQCAKVVDHFGLTYDELFSESGQEMYTRRMYKEKTPVFAYYVIKSVFMNHADSFLRWCMENNRGSLQFKKTAVHIQKLADLLKSLCKTEDYRKKMRKMDAVLKKRRSLLVETTMRMSCVSFV